MTSESLYTFSARDAASTVEIAHVLLDLYPADAQGELDDLRSEVDSIIESGDADAVIGDLFPKLLTARDGAQRAGTLPAQATGTVEQLNVSGGGVPKTRSIRSRWTFAASPLTSRTIVSTTDDPSKPCACGAARSSTASPPTVTRSRRETLVRTSPPGASSGHRSPWEPNCGSATCSPKSRRWPCHAVTKPNGSPTAITPASTTRTVTSAASTPPSLNPARSPRATPSPSSPATRDSGNGGHDYFMLRVPRMMKAQGE